MHTLPPSFIDIQRRQSDCACSYSIQFDPFNGSTVKQSSISAVIGCDVASHIKSSTLTGHFHTSSPCPLDRGLSSPYRFLKDG